MKTNVLDAAPVRTHEGAPAARVSAEQQLRRTVMACLLWEDTFYEDGVAVADRIAALVPQVAPEVVRNLAIEARTRMHLRHVPLLLARELVRSGQMVDTLLSAIIQRPDELTEFMAIYWKDGRCPVNASVKRGLGEAFRRFTAYQLAKYDRAKDKVKLRDVLRIAHPRPVDEAQAELWRQVVKDELPTPDTWESALAGGADKRETFERLITERKLGAMALIRNLRGMLAAGVPIEMLRTALMDMKSEQVLPFRFIAAARAAPPLEPELETAMLRNLQGVPKLAGETVLMVDVSGSMDAALSKRSDMKRIDAACGLAVLLAEMCEHLRVFRFNTTTAEVPPRRGFALRDAIGVAAGGTHLGAAVTAINNGVPYDRLIVISDEQSQDTVPNPRGRAYMLNVASYQNGVGNGAWMRIDGWSDSVLTYIREHEAD